MTDTQDEAVDDLGPADFLTEEADEIETGLEQQTDQPSYYFGDFKDDASQAKAFHDFVQQYGGLEQAREMLSYQQQLAQRYHSDPQARQAYDSWWNGQYQQQQQQRQEPSAPKGLEFTKYTSNPQFAAAAQAALANGGVLPDHYPNRAQYEQMLLEVQAYNDRALIDPIGARVSELDHPQVQQKIVEIANRAVARVEAMFKEYQDRALVEKYTKPLNELHPKAAAMFKSGRFGTGERAAIEAIEFSNELKAMVGQGKQNKPQEQPQERPKQKTEPGKNGKGTPSTALERVEQMRRANSSAFGRTMAKGQMKQLKQN